MKLVSTEIKAEKAGASTATISACEKPEGKQFEYGTRITISGDILDRLGLSVSDFSVGQEIKVAGVGKVTSLSSSEYESSKSQSVEIQMEDVGVDPKSTAAAEFDSAWDDSTK